MTKDTFEAMVQILYIASLNGVEAFERQLKNYWPYCTCDGDYSDGTRYCQNCGREVKE